MATNYLASKPRYEILDGLRGVAAMIVVAFHLFETYSKGPMFQILNHGYLAVDFFFVLSGFVIGYAYDDRWNRMTMRDFFKRRLVRLHPMVIMGTLIGAALFYFSDSPQFSLVMETPWWQVLLLTLLGCMMLPALPSWDIRGWSELNSLNGASWSLMWEYIANIFYALVIRHFSKLLLGIFVALSALLTIDVAFNIDVFGLLEVRNYAKYTVIGGFGLSPDQLYIGIARLLYPFFAGLLLSRINKLIKVKGGFWWCSLMITVILVVPHIGGAAQPWIDGAYNAICIIILFPLIVMMGAGSSIKGRKSVAVCKFLGEISYPLYITHYPWIYVQMSWAVHHPDAPLSTHIFVAVAIFVLAIAIAYVSLRLYDEPVREWLKQHWLIGSRKNKSSCNRMA
ncbi:MAG: acyltransferase [Prevotellaceae bacterium]|nr:acyltransferase [Prevotellaceae bacterium]